MYLEKRSERHNGCNTYEVRNNGMVLGILQNHAKGKWEYLQGESSQILSGSLWSVRKRLSNQIGETTIKPNQREIMKRAWKIQKNQVQYFECESHEIFISECMKIAHAEYQKNLKPAYHNLFNLSKPQQFNPPEFYTRRLDNQSFEVSSDNSEYVQIVVSNGQDLSCTCPKGEGCSHINIVEKRFQLGVYENQSGMIEYERSYQTL